MKYFIIRNGSSVVDKRAYGGDTSKVDGMVAEYASLNPTLTVTEVDQATFDSTSIDPQIATTTNRAGAIAIFLSDVSATAKVLRAILLVLIDEINVIRTAISLAPRTVAQARTAVQNKLSSGAAD